ncbi:hypothetical protein RUM43_012682 [Polyplax serrata]|uniref:CUT domain-containing protein n=1 Tax=Polyplax serrata TaxID=468196 RepID=A0AAN8S6G3_POLSC
MGELVEQRDLEEPIPMETVDSPVQTAQVSSERRERITPEHAVIVSVRSERPTCKDEDQEVLSVIVSPRADSRDSELLSPTSASMIDASEFRMQPEPTYQTLTSMVDRGISPAGLSPNSSYATLTPLQPLPPISTVSDKFAYGHAGSVSGSFTVMQNNLGLGYGYEKMGVSSHYPTPSLGLGIPHSPLSPQSPYSQGIQSPQKSMSPTGYESPNYHRALGGPQSPALSPPSASLHSPVNSTIHFGGAPANLNGITAMTPHGTPMSPQHSPSMGVQRDMVESPSPPTVIHRPPSQGKAMQNDMTVNVVLNAPTTSEVEEINTKELAQRISAELKRYSIPQAIFAQRVLCRSQGTLSDLLRNPKPWSKLKSGRETFRRMWKWLQEPEFQRMSALRLAGEFLNNFISHMLTLLSIPFRCLVFIILL